MKILISGVGIAGPCLAYWLLKEGKGKHEIVLVEKAEKLREEGYIVDLWGTGYEVIKRMSLESDFKSQGYEPGNMDLVNEKGERKACINWKDIVDLYNGNIISIARGHISRMLYESLPLDSGIAYDDFDEADKKRITVLFGTEITKLITPDSYDEAKGVEATFSNGMVERFDLVVGADGAFSKVRKLAFGDVGIKELNMTVAAAEVSKTGNHPSFISGHSIPGRTMYTYSTSDDRIVALFVTHGSTKREEIATQQRRKKFIQDNFSEMKWNAPAVLKEIEGQTDVYATNVVQVRMDSWKKPGVVLVGDAAACPSLVSGQGAVLGITGSYMLAYELNNAQGDVESCLQRYEKSMMKYTRKVQRESSSSFSVSSLVPKTRHGIHIRHFLARIINIRPVLRQLAKSHLSTALTLPDYQTQ